jgi:hypothetical protein
MKHDMRAAGLLVGVLLAAAATAEEPRYGVCRQAIGDYVRERLGQTVTRIDIGSYGERTTIVQPGSALVYVAECEGFHAFEIYATEGTCENLPHYGSGASYTRYAGAYEGCADTR